MWAAFQLDESGPSVRHTRMWKPTTAPLLAATAPSVTGTFGSVRFASYDPDADIAWFPTGESDDIVSERVPDGIRDYDRATRRIVAIELWDASARLPASLLEALTLAAGTQAPSFPTLREDDDITPVRAHPLD